MNVQNYLLNIVASVKYVFGLTLMLGVLGACGGGGAGGGQGSIGGSTGGMSGGQPQDPSTAAIHSNMEVNYPNEQSSLNSSVTTCFREAAPGGEIGRCMKHSASQTENPQN